MKVAITAILVALIVAYTAHSAGAQVGPGGWCASMPTANARAATNAYRAKHPGHLIGWMFAGSPYQKAVTFEIWDNNKRVVAVPLKNLCVKAKTSGPDGFMAGLPSIPGGWG